MNKLYPMTRFTILHPKAIALGKSFSLSALNQAVSSGTNLLLGVFFARSLSPSDFGWYGIGFSMVLLYGGLGSALVATQMVIHLPDHGDKLRNVYAARMFWLSVILCLVTVALGVLAYSIVPTETFGLQPDIWMAVLFASVGYLMKDYFVRLAYSRRNEKAAVLINSFVAVTIIVSIIVVASIRLRFTATIAVSIFALGQCVGGAVGAARAKLPYLDCDFRQCKKDFDQALKGGRWAVAGGAVIWLQSQAYVYVTALTVGAAGVGYINVAKLFVSPLQFLLPTAAQVMLPRMASARAAANYSVPALGRAYLVAMLAVACAYFALLSVAYPLASDVVGPHYSSLGWPIFLWSVALLAQVARDSASVSMQALKMFREILNRNAASAIIAIALAYVLSKYFGAQGAIVSVGVGELVLAILLWNFLIKDGSDVHPRDLRARA